MKGCVERAMESIPQAFGRETRTTIVFDGFGCWKFSFLDPIYKFPRASTLVSDFLNFVIEERSLRFFDSQFEGFPIISTS